MLGGKVHIEDKIWRFSLARKDQFMTNTSDLVITEADLRALARDHGLPVVFAFYPGSKILLPHTTPLPTLVEIAKASGAAFISLDAVPFDAEDFAEEIRTNLSREDLILTDAGVAAIEAEADAREEATERLELTWAGGGHLYSTTFVAEWSDALTQRVRELAEEDTEPSWRDVLVRISGLAAELEELPEFRAARPINRRAAGAQMINDLALDSDDPEMRRQAVKEAVTLAGQNAREAYFAFEDKRLDAADELAATPEWAMAWSRPARNQAATRFLAARVGYAPTKTAAEEFARLAAGKA